jgi:hypothetical protein
MISKISGLIEKKELNKSWDEKLSGQFYHYGEQRWINGSIKLAGVVVVTFALKFVRPMRLAVIFYSLPKVV